VDLGYLSLYVIATQTGGGILQTRSDLAGLISQRVEQANTFYSLTFDPQRTNQVDEYHALQAEIDKPNVTAHSLTGYFDQPVFYDQPRDGIERVTVEQLEHALPTLRGTSDAEAARQLSGLELTQRLSSAKLATWQAVLKGKKTRQALVALADQSVFLAPPPAEIPSTAMPDMTTQRQMVLRMVDYVEKTIPKLPDFFASRTIAQYHERPPKPGQTWKTAAGDQSLYLSDTSKATVIFRDGKEVVKGEVTRGKSRKAGVLRLDTVGTFGSILGTVLVAANSGVTWSR
jgi:hypothetical protein